jgi:SAM-dependent methyltransferase
MNDRRYVDKAFDNLLPQELRHLSPTHWTPVDVAIRVTTLLCPTSSTRVLDIGAGIGKLCVIGALSTSSVWCGVEQHAPLVDAANRLARALGVANRTIFTHGDVFSIDWSTFDALYLYNPFEWPLGTRPTDPRRVEAVARVQDRLAAMPGGSRVVTYHGFGGVMPSSYELVYQERVPSVGLDLVLWVQRARPRPVVGPS